MVQLGQTTLSKVACPKFRIPLAANPLRSNVLWATLTRPKSPTFRGFEAEAVD
jgi:hypothetical protein